MKEKTKEWISRIPPVLILLLFAGFLADAFSGFAVIRHAGSVVGGIGGLLLLGILYLFAECVGDRVTDMDSTEQPLLRRVFNLCVLLLAMALIGALFYYVLSVINL